MGDSASGDSRTYIDRAALPAAAGYFQRTLDAGPLNKHRRYACPLCKAGHAFSVNPDAGAWRCWACERGGGVLDFEVFSHGGDPLCREDLHIAARRLSALIEPTDDEDEDARARRERQQRTDLARQVAAAAVERERRQRQLWAENARRIAKLQAELRPLVPGDPVTLYLKRRGFGRVWPLPTCLRMHPGLPYWHGAEKLGTYPAMVAPIVAPNGQTVALHRTYLTADGRKAEVPSVKKLTGAAGPLAGACIPLFKPAQGCIGIAEGIETALAAWCASSVPTVAAYCAGNLAAWRWPTGVRRLLIFSDHDRAGIEAAAKLQAHAVRAGLQSSVMTPTDAGADWCDVWASRGAVRGETGAAA